MVDRGSSYVRLSNRRQDFLFSNIDGCGLHLYVINSLHVSPSLSSRCNANFSIGIRHNKIIAHRLKENTSRNRSGISAAGILFSDPAVPQPLHPQYHSSCTLRTTIPTPAVPQLLHSRHHNSYTRGTTTPTPAVPQLLHPRYHNCWMFEEDWEKRSRME